MNRDDVREGRSVYHTNTRHPGKLGVLTGRILDPLFPMAEVPWGGQVEFLDLAQLALFDPAARGDVFCGSCWPIPEVVDRVSLLRTSKA